MVEDNTTDQQNEDVSSDEAEWASPIRIRKGTRKRLEDLVILLTSYPGIAGLPEEVQSTFRRSFAPRNSFSPDVLIETATSALRHMLTTAPPQPQAQAETPPAKTRSSSGCRGSRS